VDHFWAKITCSRVVAALGGRGDQAASVQLRRWEVVYTVELAAGAIGWAITEQ